MSLTVDTELDLFTQAMQIARRNTRTGDPDTSLEAAHGADAAGSSLAVLRVLNATRQPIADREIHASIMASPQAFSRGIQYTDSRIRTARRELETLGYVEQVEGVTVQTSLRGHGRTWRITTAGRLHLMDNA